MSDVKQDTPFDVVGFIIQYESGEIEEEEIISGFQELINSGVVWLLQGCYSHTATALIDRGLCTRNIVEDEK